ncbi:MAG: spore coat associated protein CotJA [Clostridiales bacterium]|jgi:hypothetical protein|nr:spore coat associated protein CotJA [Clostridiales bacterium]
MFENSCAWSTPPQGCDDHCKDALKKFDDCFDLARAYVPYQRIRMLYSPEDGICRGTIFPELDKPYDKRSRVRKPSCLC